MDGVIEINQQKALAGGLNGSLAADPAGFPVATTQPGSYRITGNLRIDQNTTAIEIPGSTQRVSLDLGGFAIEGPNVCTVTTTVPCTYQTNAIGVDASNARWVSLFSSSTGRGAGIGNDSFMGNNTGGQCVGGAPGQDQIEGNVVATSCNAITCTTGTLQMGTFCPPISTVTCL